MDLRIWNTTTGGNGDCNGQHCTAHSLEKIGKREKTNNTT